MPAIAIIGLGYVGLPLCLQFARNGSTVLGLDIDAAKVDAINASKSYIHHITAESVAEQVTAVASRPAPIFRASPSAKPSSFAFLRRSAKIANPTFPTSSTPPAHRPPYQPQRASVRFPFPLTFLFPRHSPLATRYSKALDRP